MEEIKEKQCPSWISSDNILLGTVGTLSAVAIGSGITALFMNLLRYTKVPAWFRSSYFVAVLLGTGAVGSVLTIVLIAKKHLDAKDPLPTPTTPPSLDNHDSEDEIESDDEDKQGDLTQPPETQKSTPITPKPKGKQPGLLEQIELKWIEPELTIMNAELTIITTQLSIQERINKNFEKSEAIKNQASKEYFEFTTMPFQIQRTKASISEINKLIEQLKARIVAIKSGAAATSKSMFPYDLSLLISEVQQGNRQEGIFKAFKALGDGLTKHCCKQIDNVDKRITYFSNMLPGLQAELEKITEDSPDYESLKGDVDNTRVVIEQLHLEKEASKTQRDDTLTFLYKTFGECGFPDPIPRIQELEEG